MREIKFQVYDKNQKYFYSKGDFIGNYDDLYFEDINIIFTNKDLIFQQYTGLNDNSGIEIYEGDVLQFIKERNPMDSLMSNYFSGDINEVIWKNSMFLLGDDELYSCIKHGEFKIIGNICSNPELLKSKNIKEEDVKTYGDLQLFFKQNTDVCIDENNNPSLGIFTLIFLILIFLYSIF